MKRVTRQNPLATGRDLEAISSGFNGDYNGLTNKPAVIAAGATVADAQAAIELSSAIEAAGLVDRFAAHGMVEFRWILPTSVYLAEPYRHTLLACLGNSNSTSTPVLIVDVSHESGAVQTYQVGTVAADDHNAPSVITAPGDPIVVQWTQHSATNLMYYKVGLADRPDSLVSAPLQTISMGGPTSYGQAWKIDALSNDEEVVYYRLYRYNGTEWYLLKETVNRATLQVTTNSPGVHLVSGEGTQFYCTTARGSKDAQKIRVGVAPNPSAGNGWLFYFEIDFVTGAVTSPFDETFSANLSGTNLPVTRGDIVGFLPTFSGAKTGYERRLLAVRPWPAALGVLTAEGDPADRAGTAHYYLNEWDGDFTGNTTGDPASATGLIVPLTAGTTAVYAKTTEIPLATSAASIKVTTHVKLPPSKPANAYLEVCGQDMEDSTNQMWRLDIGATTNELKVRFYVNRTGPALSTLTSTSALAGATWGSEVWIRSTYTVASSGTPVRRWTIESSLNGTTWTEIGAIAGNSGNILIDPAAYTFIGSRGAAFTGDLVIYSTKIEIGGTTRTDIDFTNDSTGWPGYATAYTDSNGNDWGIVGIAEVGRTAYGPTIPPTADPVIRDFGLTGGSLYASYYPGAAFQGASVILARTNGANQELVASYFVDGALQETVLRTQPTTDGKFFRPMPPDNGGPLWCWLVNATSYGTNDFYDWQSSAIAVRRL